MASRSADRLGEHPTVAAPIVIKSRATPASILIVWCFAAVSLVLLGDATAFSQRSTTFLITIMLTSLGIIVAVLLAGPATLRVALSQLKLGPWIALTFSVVFGLSTLVWLSPATGSTKVVNRDYLDDAAFVTAVGLLALLAGYVVAPRAWRTAANRLDQRIRGKAPSKPSATAVASLWICSLTGTLLQIQGGSFGYLSDPTAALGVTGSSNAIVAAFANLGLTATLLAAWRVGLSATAGSRILLTLVMGSQIILGLFAAQKEPVIIQLVAFFIGYGCWKRVRILPVTIGVLVVVLFVFPFVGQYRDLVAQDSGRLSPTDVVAQVDFGRLLSSTFDASSGDSTDTAVARLTRIGDVAVIMQKTPSSVQYRPATDLLAGPALGFVPRSLWEGKPVLDAGYQMSSVYYGLPPSVYSSSALTPYGDLWRHGGLAVVIVGMALLGVLARMVDSRTGDIRQDPRILFLPILLFVPLVKQESDYLGFTASLVSIIILSAVGARIVSATSRSPSRRPRRIATTR